MCSLRSPYSCLLCNVLCSPPSVTAQNILRSTSRSNTDTTWKLAKKFSTRNTKSTAPLSRYSENMKEAGSSHDFEPIRHCSGCNVPFMCPRSKPKTNLSSNSHFSESTRHYCDRIRKLHCKLEPWALRRFWITLHSYLRETGNKCMRWLRCLMKLQELRTRACKTSELAWFQSKVIVNAQEFYVRWKVKQSLYRSGQALRVPEGWSSHTSWQSSHEGGTVVSPTHRPSLPPPPSQEIFLVLFSGRCWGDPRAIVRLEGLRQWKIPMTPSGIEPNAPRRASLWMAVPQNIIIMG